VIFAARMAARQTQRQAAALLGATRDA